TLGKRATNIRVVRESGEVITYGYALKRELLVKGILFGLFGHYLVIPSVLNYLWPLWDGQNRALHDMIVHSRVVRDYPAVSPAPYAPDAALQF
ncbi:MAG: RDD family protein, partial [Thermoleophilaceae bacterium]|nr:RDD family protein [Thermoleophilaceae bacterium]